MEARAVYVSRPEPDGPAAVAAGIHPADRAGVPAAVKTLDLADIGHRGLGGRASDGRRGVHRGHHLKGTGNPKAGMRRPGRVRRGVIPGQAGAAREGG
jgi:hypothetical protein